MTDIRVAAEQARVALQDAWVEQRAWLDDRDLPHDGCVLLPKISAALASLEAALAAQPSPVEAQAVPDQPVAKVNVYDLADNFGVRWKGPDEQGWSFQEHDFYDFCCALRDRISSQFTRPTPAAADLTTEIAEEYSASRYGGTADSIIAMSKEIQRLRAQLVAASPAAAAQQPMKREWLDAAAEACKGSAAAAGVPTGWKLVPVEPTWEMERAGQESEGRSTGKLMESPGLIYKSMLAASPVAPVGAPTDLGAMWDRFIALRSKNLGVQVKNLIGSAEAMRDDFINANRAQGCELATDATKQLREHSVHLAMSTSSVPTAAPLLSSRETDRSELPRASCPHCDGTGAVHRADGEFLGACTCPAGRPEPTEADWAAFGEWAERDRKDAARYLWLRNEKAYVGVHPHHRDLPRHQRTGWTMRFVYETPEGTLDAAIDAAMKEQK